MSLEVKNMSFSYKYNKILKDVSFVAKKGELLALLGPNGAGKTTLLKCISGLLKPFGEVIFDGRLLNKMSFKEISKIVSYFAQSSGNSGLSVFESILLSRKPHIKNSFSAKDYAIVQSIIKMLNIAHLSLKKLDHISGGEAQKVRIAQLLAQESKILLIDEPLNNLDLKNQIEVMRLLKSLIVQKNLIVIVAMHDLNIAFNYADKLLFLRDGYVIDFCSLEQLDNCVIDKTYGVKMDILNQKGKKICIPYF
ncbi:MULTISPECIES: ABC transporter ATP-binding protein [Desulfurella]|jgi:iron complex transport system ATP-binding protein|uniref:Iron complex transport system ATP-binding protein n=1 Tax=Desulfurella multipotens TaxID=79269 RepID=A0A1G6JQE7_9BACT|nr:MULTISPECIES: ABC transporter ATP-binding protein [Desulfurella]AHF97177.1 iron ABC transporter [Desulfurella acetivorans A63]HEX14057.1 ABC transporter ATP-binding protein [Desulfurella acetivorans]PMP62773.1 MAG: ABC transporter ATP-binding protein [Desulfurella multipotens]PMP87985.1 MAG: ABC transporter ATP-binding protein [Desulfurella sp.]SDC20982.1 iron complex transport system ATP-binding protein [Desulfurella multipotens]